MDVVIRRASVVQGALTVPPDKAICHRVVLAASLARGETEISPWPSADDCQWTLHVIEGLGVSVRRSSDSVWIRGQGSEGLRAPTDVLFCGGSGTTLRLAAGLLAGQPFQARLSAGPSLSGRPMGRVVEPLSQMGARLEGRMQGSGTCEIYPPLTIHGRRPLRAIRYPMGVASAQVKSAVLLAGLFADGRTTVIELHPTRDHTERILRRCGAAVWQEGPDISIEPGSLRAPGHLVLPGDFSSAAFFLVAAACVPGSRVTIHEVSLNPTRTTLLGVLERMGTGVSWSVTDNGWEPRGTVSIEQRPLRGVAVEAHEVPALIDELPILMVAAACAQGTTRLSGVGELRVKETDRIRSMVEGLGRLGARVRLAAQDAVEIDGGPLSGGLVDSADDHRTAMSLAVAGLAAVGPTTVQRAGCVAKSFPEFFDQLRIVAGSSTVKTVDNTTPLC